MTQKIIPMIGIAVLMLVVIFVPILTYFEHRKVLAWMEHRRHNRLIASPPSIAIELQVLDLGRIEVREPMMQEVELYWVR
jgi:NADH:ubiquinone oxidoreductase subunit H